MPDENVLLAWMGCGLAESHATDLAGLGATPIQERGAVEHIRQQDIRPCHSALPQSCVKPTFF